MKKIKNPIKAIREKCLECSCGQTSEVKLCPNEQCALYPFRMGKNPYVTRTLSEEQKEAASERLKKARALKKAKIEKNISL